MRRVCNDILVIIINSEFEKGGREKDGLCPIQDRRRFGRPKLEYVKNRGNFGFI